MMPNTLGAQPLAETVEERRERHRLSFAVLFAYDTPERRARIKQIKRKYERSRPRVESPADVWARSSGEQRFELVEKIMSENPTWREMTISRYFNAYEASVSRIVRRILYMQEFAATNTEVHALVSSLAPDC